jgi:hypothetical protein
MQWLCVGAVVIFARVALEVLNTPKVRVTTKQKNPKYKGWHYMENINGPRWL